MAQRKPDDKVTVDQVLKLVDQLSTDEQEQVRKKLSNRSWGPRFQQLCDKVEVTRVAKGLPRLTEEEIMAEVKAVRDELKAERADQSGN
jgi:Tfp pilus assembly pilus retraction ATPase PilT